MRRKGRSNLAIVTIALVTIATMTAVPAAAELATATSTPDIAAEPGEEDITSAEQALRNDARAVADQGIMSEEAAAALFAVQPDMEDFIAWAGDRFSDRVAGCGLRPSPDRASSYA